MTAPRAQEPLPCPFCGAKPQPFAAVHWECPVEDCAGHSLFATIEEWNRRAPSADTRRLDWLQSNAAYLQAENLNLHSFIGFDVPKGLNLRSAIDAAMTQEGE